jgi:hypothetical protein
MFLVHAMAAATIFVRSASNRFVGPPGMPHWRFLMVTHAIHAQAAF